MNTHTFNTTLHHLVTNTLHSPLTEGQREYLEMCRDRIQQTGEFLPFCMQAPWTYVVEVLCHAAYLRAMQPGIDLETAVASAYPQDGKRRELMTRCIQSFDTLQ